jgi:hypothetical protein
MCIVLERLGFAATACLRLGPAKLVTKEAIVLGLMLGMIEDTARRRCCCLGTLS